MKMTNIPTLVASMALGLAFTTTVSAQSEFQADEASTPEPVEKLAEPGEAKSVSDTDLQPTDEFAPGERGRSLDAAAESFVIEEMAADGVEIVRDEEGFIQAGQFMPSEASAGPRINMPAPQSQSRNPFSRRDSRESAPLAPQQIRMAFGPDTNTPMPADRDDQIRLNFRGVPLEMVLNYLSEAAGFIIVPKVDIKGTVDVWSNQPLTKDEVVEVLNTQLKDNNYAAIRNGRILTIVSREQAGKTGPVVSGNNPADIPKTDEIVTQIIPVRYINAAALTANLQPLLPSQANLTANEAGNALILTDTQSNIRRMVEIVSALDTSVSSISTVRVFPLNFADAKELATIVTTVFETPSQGNNQGGRNRFENFFRGGGRGGGGGEDTAANAGGRAGAARVTAVADERSNSLVVSAPNELIPTIEELVASVDTNIEDITDLKVFHLTHADPVETAELLTNLFEDETQNNNRNVRFGRGRPNFGNAANTQSDRMQKQARVVAVPDQRTGSIVVSAARTMMPQIEEMVAQLDSDPAGKKKVFVFDVQNSDPQNVLQTLQGLFESPAGSNTRNTRNNNNALGSQLNTRATQQQNQRNTQNTLGGGNFGTGNVGR